MSLTARQDIPNAPKEAPGGWTKKSIMTVSSAFNTIAKTFNALEAILLFQIVVTGIGELCGRRLSIGWYVVLCLTLAVNAYLRITEKGTAKSV